MNFNKTLLLSAIIAVSNSALAETQQYVVELSGEIASELGFSLIDDLGNPVPQTQTVTMQETPDGLGATRLFEGTSIKSNDPAQQYTLVRTLSPFTVDGEVGNYSAEYNQLSNSYGPACDETMDTNKYTEANEELKLTTFITGEGKLCPTNVRAAFTPGTPIPAGIYASTLTLDISPRL